MRILCEWLNIEYHTQEMNEVTTNICNNLHKFSITVLSARNQASSDMWSVKLWC